MTTRGTGVEGSIVPTLADLVEAAIEVPPDWAALEVDRLFMSSPGVRAVVVLTEPPVVMSRDYFQHLITGPWGYGRALHQRSRVDSMPMPDTLILPSEMSAFEASDAILARPPETHHDYVLVMAAHGVLGVVSASTVMRSIAEQYAHRAAHDPLTGLANRSGLLARLGDRSRDGDIALLFLDLDRFKLINDSLGHASGDELLIEVGARIRSCLREVDVACRLGGDEFVVLLHDVEKLEDAIEVARRLLATIEEPVMIAGKSILPSASLGVAVGTLSRVSPDELLRHADLAMYEAKGRGRGGFHVFELGLQQRAGARFDLDSRLRKAVHDQTLHLHFQPIVDLASGETVKFEALVRWDDPTRGRIAPESFVPLAEDSGLIIPLGRWVLERACREMSEHLAGHAGVRPTLSVNVSARQLLEADFADTVLATLANTGWSPEHLCLELTERVALNDSDAVRARMEALTELGVEFALDDFGTGHSSLRVLRGFPFAEVKIDRSFVSGIASSPTEETVVRLTVELAHTLGQRVTAEGIETPDQLAALASTGCDLAQGYLFARPARLASFGLAIGLDEALGSAQGSSRHLDGVIERRQLALVAPPVGSDRLDGGREAVGHGVEVAFGRPTHGNQLTGERAHCLPLEGVEIVREVGGSL